MKKQIDFTLSRNQAAVMHQLLVAGIAAAHRAGVLPDEAEAIASRIERRLGIYRIELLPPLET